MKLNSQTCTTKEQSERLLALGLKKETADCILAENPFYSNEYIMLPLADDGSNLGDAIPSWSLNRLIEILPDEITIPDTGDNDGYEGELEDLILEPTLFKKSVNYSDGYSTIFFEDHDNVYDNIIDCIKWLIEKEQFNKEYLEEQICGN